MRYWKSIVQVCHGLLSYANFFNEKKMRMRGQDENVFWINLDKKIVFKLNWFVN